MEKFAHELEHELSVCHCIRAKNRQFFFVLRELCSTFNSTPPPFLWTGAVRSMSETPPSINAVYEVQEKNSKSKVQGIIVAHLIHRDECAAQRWHVQMVMQLKDRVKIAEHLSFAHADEIV